MEVNAELIKAMQVRNYSTTNIRARCKDRLQFANSVAVTWLGSTMKPSHVGHTLLFNETKYFCLDAS